MLMQSWTGKKKQNVALKGKGNVQRQNLANCGKAKVADFGVGQHFMKIGENHSVRLAKHCRMRG